MLPSVSKTKQTHPKNKFASVTKIVCSLYKRKNHKLPATVVLESKPTYRNIMGYRNITGEEESAEEINNEPQYAMDPIKWMASNHPILRLFFFFLFFSDKQREL